MPKAASTSVWPSMQAKLLIIDELGYLPFNPSLAHRFFQLVSRRYEHGSLLIASLRTSGMNRDCQYRGVNSACRQGVASGCRSTVHAAAAAAFTAGLPLPTDRAYCPVRPQGNLDASQSPAGTAQCR
jgi:hypothetical protein